MKSQEATGGDAPGPGCAPTPEGNIDAAPGTAKRVPGRAATARPLPAGAAGGSVPPPGARAPAGATAFHGKHLGGRRRHATAGWHPAARVERRAADPRRRRPPGARRASPTEDPTRPPPRHADQEPAVRAPAAPRRGPRRRSPRADGGPAAGAPPVSRETSTLPERGRRPVPDRHAPCACLARARRAPAGDGPRREDRAGAGARTRGPEGEPRPGR